MKEKKTFIEYLEEIYSKYDRFLQKNSYYYIFGDVPVNNIIASVFTHLRDKLKVN